MSSTRKFRSPGVLTVVLSYAFFSGLWILLSDRAVAVLFSDPTSVMQASIFKGWLFVAITSLLLYLLVDRLVSQLNTAHQRDMAYEREQKQPPPMLVAIADASVDAIFAKDEEGRYLLFNNAAERFVGKSASEVLGKDDQTLFPSEQAVILMAIDRRVRESGDPETNEEIVDTPGGRRVFQAIKGPLRAVDGKIFGTYGISRDISDRKREEELLHESQERLRLLIDHAPTALAMFDRDMCYLEASQRWKSDYLFGATNFVGQSHYTVLPELAEHMRAMHRRGMEGETVSMNEDRFQHADGTVQWLRWEIMPWLEKDGKIGGIVIFSEDITPRKRADGELKRRNDELERFNAAATERELRMIALKREVNEMAVAAGKPAPYDMSFLDPTEAKSE